MHTVYTHIPTGVLPLVSHNCLITLMRQKRNDIHSHFLSTQRRALLFVISILCLKYETNIDGLKMSRGDFSANDEVRSSSFSFTVAFIFNLTQPWRRLIYSKVRCCWGVIYLCLVDSAVSSCESSNTHQQGSSSSPSFPRILWSKLFFFSFSLPFSLLLTPTPPPPPFSLRGLGENGTVIGLQ